MTGPVSKAALAISLLVAVNIATDESAPGWIRAGGAIGGMMAMLTLLVL